MSTRREELSAGLALVRSRVASAAAAAGRSSESITVIVVTKTWPSSDVRILHDLGVRDFGENRSQEAEAKAAQLADLPITWHFIGQIQSNKAARIASYASVIHSVSSTRLVSRLNTGAERFDRYVDCLVQVSLDSEPQAAGRGGVPPAEVEAVAEAIEAAPRLRLRGVMGIAPLHENPEPAYRRLREVAGKTRAQHPAASLVSAGMSGDFEAAVAAGATHVRVGSAILGERPPNR